MEEIIQEEVKQIENEIIRIEAQMYEMDKHLTSLMSRRAALITLAQKSKRTRETGKEGEKI